MTHDQPASARGARFTLLELDAMYDAASRYEAAGATDRREPCDAEFIFYRFAASEIPPDGEGDEPSLPGIYMADADVPEEGVLPVITYGPEGTDAQVPNARPAPDSNAEPNGSGRNEVGEAVAAPLGVEQDAIKEVLDILYIELTGLVAIGQHAVMLNEAARQIMALAAPSAAPPDRPLTIAGAMRVGLGAAPPEAAPPETKELRGPPLNGQLFCPQTGEWLPVTNLYEWYERRAPPSAQQAPPPTTEKQK